MSGRRNTQRRKRSSASEGAGGASLAAAGSLVNSRGMAELYAAVSAGNISWGTMANLNMKKVEEEGLGAALKALRAPKKLSRKEQKALYAKEAAAAAATGTKRSPSELRRYRETLKKTTKGRH